MKKLFHKFSGLPLAIHLFIIIVGILIIAVNLTMTIAIIQKPKSNLALNNTGSNNPAKDTLGESTIAQSTANPTIYCLGSCPTMTPTPPTKKTITPTLFFYQPAINSNDSEKSSNSDSQRSNRDSARNQQDQQQQRRDEQQRRQERQRQDEQKRQDGRRQNWWQRFIDFITRLIRRWEELIRRIYPDFPGFPGFPRSPSNPQPTTAPAPQVTTSPSSPAPTTGGQTTPAPTTSTPIGMRAVPEPWYGVTVDTVSNVNMITAASQALSRMPVIRIVFDEGQPPSDYESAIDAMRPSSYIMGEILDSSSMADTSLAEYKARTTQYLQALGDKVDIWELGNEVNGNWTGPYPEVGAKLYDAYQQVEAAGLRSSVTLWYNDSCGNGSSELDPIAFSTQHLPQNMRNGIDYVLVSYYETQCNNIRPTEAKWNQFFTQLRAVYPTAKLGIGEIGFPDAVGSNTTAATSMINYYHGLNITVPGYIGGYFWWYYYQDMLPHTSKPLFQVLNNAFLLY